MKARQRTVALLIWPAIAWLGVACDQVDTPTGPSPQPDMLVITSATRVVDDDGMATVENCDALNPTHMTITAALTAANPGETIRVCPGIYNESPTINKNDITLLGAKAGVPAGPDAIPAGRGVVLDESVVNATAVAGHVIRTNNRGTTIDGFTLNSDPASTGQHGVSIGSMASGATVANNIINGLAPAPTNIASGILTATFSNQTLLHNNAQGFLYGVQPDGGPADAPSAIDGNYLSNNAFMGIQIQSSASGGHSILNNLIELNGFDGIFVTRGEIVSGNTIRDNGRAGILLFSLGNGTLTGAMITDNEIRDNAQYGIRLSGTDAGDLSNNHANQNNIVGNTAGVVSTLASTVFDAECNWWGSATGPRDPAGNPFGTGDSSTGNVDYEPWLIAPAPGGDCVGEPLPAAGRVTGGGQIDVANGRGSFGFNAKLDEGETTGHLNYRNHVTGAHLNCTVTAFLVLTPTTATFSGTCNPQSSADEFTAHVEDNGEPGKNSDEFTIEYNGTTEGGTLRSGNIQIH